MMLGVYVGEQDDVELLVHRCIVRYPSIPTAEYRQTLGNNATHI